MTFDQFALPTFRNLPIRAKTRATYESAYRCHIGPVLGPIPLQDLTRSHVQEVLDGMRPQMARTTLACIKTLCREAASLGILDNSQACQVFVAKPHAVPRPFLTIKELEAMELGKYRTQVMFLAKHGLRWGEAMALTTQDFRDGMITINKSIHGPTKTRSGVRLVPQLSEYIPLPRSPKTLRNTLHPLGIHIHSLRHTYAYLLKSSGVHVTTAQRLMGHSSPSITLGIYTQFRGTELEDAAQLMLTHLLN